MHIDPRLNEIDGSLYRVAIRAIIAQDEKVLLVNENDGGDWWAIPGGGVDHGETIESCLFREIEEELGVPATSVLCNFQIIYYDIGKVVNDIPRMNIFFKASIPEKQIKKTAHVEKWTWFTKKDFLELDMNPSYDKPALANVIFS
jgi:8-oxo-dGTP pyrophosphatase MutT (NUDIX family)